MLSKNAPLAELRLFPFVPINRLESPINLVMNRAFQIAINKILSGWKLRCCLTAACASGTQGLAAPAPCVKENMSGYDDLRSLQVQKVTARLSGRRNQAKMPRDYTKADLVDIW